MKGSKIHFDEEDDIEEDDELTDEPDETTIDDCSVDPDFPFEEEDD